MAFLLLLTGCSIAKAQRGGTATSTITRPGHTNAATLVQSENPKEPSHQTIQSDQVLEYVLPAGTEIGLENGSPQAGVDATQTSVNGVESPRPWPTHYSLPTTNHGSLTLPMCAAGLWLEDGRPYPIGAAGSTHSCRSSGAGSPR